MSLGVIGRYQMLQELGRGACGTVYKGHDPVIDRAVALKTIAFRQGDDADDDVKDVRKRLYREACAAGTLMHPNIVTIFDVIEEGGTTAVAMEFVDGTTLAALIVARAPLPVDSALEIFEQIAAALDFAHAKGIVHRDIKPANILITADGRVKVSDFGVARIASANHTVTSAVLGAPSYMSPEQVRGAPVDSRTDLFSAAVVLYELLTRHRPFDGEDIASTMYKIVHDPAPPPSQFNAAIGATVTAVFERALAKAPDQRFRSGAEFAGAMRQAVGTQTFEPAGAATVLVRPPAKSGKRSKLILIAAIPFVLVLALIVFGAIVGQPQPAPPPSNAPVAAAPLPAATPNAPESHPVAAAEPLLQPVPPPQMPASTVPPVAVSTVPPVAAAPPEQAAVNDPPRTRPAPRQPRAPAATQPFEEIRAAERPAPPPVQASPPPPVALPPAPPPAAPATGSIQFSFDGTPFPVTVLRDGRPAGYVADAQSALTVDAGRVDLRIVNEGLYLNHAFGALTIAPGERRTLPVPGVASAFVGVRNDNYTGLKIYVDDRLLPGPYPAQVPRIAASLHKLLFRWTEGTLRGVEIAAMVDLSTGRQFLIRAVPETSQVTLQRMR